jgi:ATP/maltotriose-dependent transcriptional regulator MalT
LGRGVPVEGFGAAVLAALNFANAKVVDTVLPGLVNELGEVPQELTLVLDDYQFATDDGCRESMEFLWSTSPKTSTSFSQPAPTRPCVWDG